MMRFNLNPRPKHRQMPDPEYTYEGELENSRQVVCPRCGKNDGLFPIQTIFYPGEVYHVYECFNYYRRTNANPSGLCGQRLYDHVYTPRILWVSPNGLWVISLLKQEGNYLKFCISNVDSDQGTWRTLYSEYECPWAWNGGCDPPKYVRDALLGILRDYGYKGEA